MTETSNRQRIILGLIILMAFFLRFWRLSEFPVGFHIDEASLGYNAYSLLKTGKDENGKFLPLHIDMFGDNRPAGYQYLDIIPIKIFGLNEFATRLPSALFGALTVLMIYFLAKELFISRPIALIAGFLLAISPWHVVTSRAGAETIVALFFIILGAYCFLKNKHYWVIFFWGLSLFFYHSSRILVPLLAIVFVVLQKKIRRQHWMIILILVGLSFLLIFGSGGGTGRFKQVSIFHYPEIRLVLEEQIREAGIFGVPVWLTRIVHNKIVNYGLGFIKEYCRYFSANFLFLEGGLPAWYLIPNMGLMYLWELPFLLVGLFSLIRNRNRNRLFWLPIIWLVLAPTVAGLTRDDVPNIQRSLVMLPALIMIVSFGFWKSWLWAKDKLASVVRILAMLAMTLVILWNFGYFFHQYFIHAKIHRPWYRFNGFKEMVQVVNQMASGFDKVIVSKVEGGIYMHFLFFTPYDPSVYQAEGSPKDKEFGGFGKFVFVPDECIDDPTARGKVDSKARVLLVASGKCDKMPFTSKEAIPIYRPDNTVVFRIYVPNR